MRATWFVVLAACHHGAATHAPPEPPERDMCAVTLATVVNDPDAKLRRKVVVSDLHLGPGTSDPMFAGVEDFYAEAEWDAFLREQAAVGPTDLVIAGDFIDFWQIAASAHVLPSRDDPKQPQTGAVLAADQKFSTHAADLAIAAHPGVFRSIHTFLASGDHRAIVIAGNHDADLLWPRVQKAIAKAVDSPKFAFVDAAAYEHGGVHIEHGHAYDPANRFETNHTPFARDTAGTCRLQSNWGEIFVDRFYTETERQVPFIDNLYPESAAILWGMKDNPDLQRDVGAAYRFIELIRVAESKKLNRQAISSAFDSILGTDDRGTDVLGHIGAKLGKGDASADAIIAATMRLVQDPELAPLFASVVAAARALPDFGAALDALKTADPKALLKLRDELLGEPYETAARKALDANPELSVIVYGHTHAVGGELHELSIRKQPAWYANTGSWLSVASVAELRAKGITWDKLSLADRTMFPTKATAIVIEYDGARPKKPVVRNR